MEEFIIAYLLTRNNGWLELYKDCMLMDKECWDKDKCDCIICEHCDRCNNIIKGDDGCE